MSWRRDAAVWRAFVGMGLQNNLIPVVLLFWAQTVLRSGLASGLDATTPLFSLLAARVVTDVETLAAPRIAGLDPVVGAFGQTSATNLMMVP